ncbi:hypothetical protein B0H14DRAFT_2555112 [Mycena olivaceomarginata]|nr:hypothetical protein B0H14DRAFT_2555112 [Mycena olivaceomarginata]
MGEATSSTPMRLFLLMQTTYRTHWSFGIARAHAKRLLEILSQHLRQILCSDWQLKRKKRTVNEKSAVVVGVKLKAMSERLDYAMGGLSPFFVSRESFKKSRILIPKARRSITEVLLPRDSGTRRGNKPAILGCSNPPEPSKWLLFNDLTFEPSREFLSHEVAPLHQHDLPAISSYDPAHSYLTFGFFNTGWLISNKIIIGVALGFFLCENNVVLAPMLNHLVKVFLVDDLVASGVVRLVVWLRLGVILVNAGSDTQLAFMNHFPLFPLMLRAKDPWCLPGGIYFGIEYAPDPVLAVKVVFIPENVESIHAALDHLHPVQFVVLS